MWVWRCVCHASRDVNGVVVWTGAPFDRGIRGMSFDQAWYVFWDRRGKKLPLHAALPAHDPYCDRLIARSPLRACSQLARSPSPLSHTAQPRTTASSTAAQTDDAWSLLDADTCRFPSPEDCARDQGGAGWNRTPPFPPPPIHTQRPHPLQPLSLSLSSPIPASKSCHSNRVS